MGVSRTRSITVILSGPRMVTSGSFGGPQRRLGGDRVQLGQELGLIHSQIFPARPPGDIPALMSTSMVIALPLEQSFQSGKLRPMFTSSSECYNLAYWCGIKG